MRLFFLAGCLIFYKERCNECRKRVENPYEENPAPVLAIFLAGILADCGVGRDARLHLLSLRSMGCDPARDPGWASGAGSPALGSATKTLISIHDYSIRRSAKLHSAFFVSRSAYVQRITTCIPLTISDHFQEKEQIMAKQCELPTAKASW